MALHRFFLSKQRLEDEADNVFPLHLSDSDLHHAKVARIACGEHIAVIDADCNYFECEVERFDDGEMFVSISQRLKAPTLRIELALFQGMPKASKFETVLRHATEVGVTSFHPLICERSQFDVDKKRLDSKMKRWRGILESAAQQSGAFKIPDINEPLCVRDAIDILEAFDAVLVCWEEADVSQSLKVALGDVLKMENPKVAVIVGPEGGLSEQEVDSVLGLGSIVHLVSLGPTILRTETAGIVAPALALYELRT